MLFYALSDDIKSAKEKLLIEENRTFDIVFPGDGDLGSPGMFTIIEFLILMENKCN